MQGLPSIMSMQFIVDGEEITKMFCNSWLCTRNISRPIRYLLINMSFGSFISEKSRSVGWKRGTPAIILIAFFLLDHNLFKVCFTCISPYLITICQVGVNERIVETQQSIFIQVFSSFNDNSNTSRDFAWNVVDMILPCKFIVYDYSKKFGFTCFTFSFSVYHKINFCWNPLVWENHIMRLLYV